MLSQEEKQRIKVLEEKIQALTNLGYNLVIIEGEIFQFDEFNEANSNQEYHFVTGRKLNSVLDNNSISLQIESPQTQKQVFLTHMDAQPVQTMLYHKDYKFICYLQPDRR